jgi:hypothetical protein
MAILKIKDEKGNVIDIPSIKGEKGATFTPSVSEDGTLSWTNDKGLENPVPFNIVNAVIDALPKYNGEVEQV